MKYLLHFTVSALLIGHSIPCIGQCEIKNRIRGDGSMYYYMDPVLFYQSNNRELKGDVITDKENYFISLQPRPFPPKPDGMKLNNDVQIRLSNQKTYALKNFDLRYMKADSIFEMVYLIDNKMSVDLLQTEVESVTIQLIKGEPPQVFTLKLHRKAFGEQLKCLKDMH